MTNTNTAQSTLAITYQTGPRAGQQIAAQRLQRKREQLAEDLARWAGSDAEAAHDADIEAKRHRGAQHYTYCCDHAHESAARDMYAFAMKIPLDALRARHLAEHEERAVERVKREGLFDSPTR